MFALQAGITGTFNLGKVVLTEAAANTRLMYIFAPTTKYSLVINGTKFLNYYKIECHVCHEYKGWHCQA